MKRLATYVGTLALSATLSGCSLHPLYAGGSSSSVASVLGEVEIAPVASKHGWLVVNALRDRLPSRVAAAIYRIEIHLMIKSAASASAPTIASLANAGRSAHAISSYGLATIRSC